jgi:hypothetical protein
MNSVIRIALVFCVSILGITCLSAQQKDAAGGQTAAKVDGVWNARVGRKQYTFEFKSSEGAMTGSVTPEGGKPVAISEGEVDGEDFAFLTVEDGKKWTWSGYLDSGRLEGEREADDDDSFETFSAEAKK